MFYERGEQCRSNSRRVSAGDLVNVVVERVLILDNRPRYTVSVANEFIETKTRASLHIISVLIVSIAIWLQCNARCIA